MTTIIIVDDQNSIRQFLKVNLATEVDIEIIGMADNGQSAIAQVGEHQPDVVLMDIEMPGEIDGIEATEAISTRFPQTKVLLFTSQDDRKQLNRALKAGARGYVLKNTSIKDIGHIIRLTEKGFFQIGPILGNWEDSEVDTAHSNLVDPQTEYTPSISAIVRDSEYSYSDDLIANPSQMNHVLSNLTSGIFQLQETIKSQGDTIVDLTQQYSKVQQEIKTKLNKNRNSNHNRVVKYRPSKFKTPSERRQQFLFISSFLLGIFTVIVLMLMIAALGGML